MLLTCKHVYVYSGDRCRLNVRGISHQCQCFYSWIAFACLYQVLRSLNISVFFIDECACLFIALLACISAQDRLYGIVRAYGRV